MKVIVLTWLSSFAYVLYLVILEQRSKFGGSKFSAKDKLLTPEQVIAQMEKYKTKKR